MAINKRWKNPITSFTATTLTVLSLTACSDIIDNSPKDNNNTLAEYKTLCDEVSHHHDTSIEMIASDIRLWRSASDTVFTVLTRDTVSQKAVENMRVYFAAHDSVAAAMTRRTVAKERTFEDVLALKHGTTPYAGDKDVQSAANQAQRFFNGLDSLDTYGCGLRTLLETYQSFLSQTASEGLGTRQQLLSFLTTEDVLFRSFLTHLDGMNDASVSQVTALTDSVFASIKERIDGMTPTELTVYMAMRANRRLIANARKCADDIKSGMTIEPYQQAAYLWMLVQPFASLDDLAMAVLTESQAQELDALADDLNGITASMSKTLGVSEDKLDAIPMRLMELYISSL